MNVKLCKAPKDIPKSMIIMHGKIYAVSPDGTFVPNPTFSGVPDGTYINVIANKDLTALFKQRNNFLQWAKSMPKSFKALLK